jgi:hypothetical protein
MSRVLCFHNILRRLSGLCKDVRMNSLIVCMQAKTAFPGLGSPITHVDVTYDGKWVLATTDTFLILISTSFKDKDGKWKIGFSGRTGGQVFAPRLLKLLPVDANRGGKQQKLHGGLFSWVSRELVCGLSSSDCCVILCLLYIVRLEICHLFGYNTMVRNCYWCV